MVEDWLLNKQLANNHASCWSIFPVQIDLLDRWQELYGKRTAQEFKSEVLAYSKIEHLNLVKFYGYLEHLGEKIIVVEYVSNGTLYDHLHGKLVSVSF